MKIVAQKITPENFSPYGTCYKMFTAEEGVKHSKGDSFEDHMTVRPLVDTQVHLGVTVGSGTPCRVVTMEKHSHTQEAILCMKEPILFCVAQSEEGKAPEAKNLQAFLMEPGDVAVIEREIWHDACHGLNHDTAYYWIAMAGKTPAVWEKVQGDAELTWLKGGEQE